MPANCDRHIWGPLPWPLLQSLHRGGYYCHPQPRSTADWWQQASAHGQAGALASGQFPSLRILDWELVSRSVAEAGGRGGGRSRTGACKREGHVSQEAPGSEKGQKAARAWAGPQEPPAGTSFRPGLLLFLESPSYYLLLHFTLKIFQFTVKLKK